MNAEEKQVEILSQDSFDRDITPAEAAKAMKGTFNFDHPDGYNNKIMESVLKPMCPSTLQDQLKLSWRAHHNLPFGRDPS